MPSTSATTSGASAAAARRTPPTVVSRTGSEVSAGRWEVVSSIVESPRSGRAELVVEDRLALAQTVGLQEHQGGVDHRRWAAKVSPVVGGLPPPPAPGD